MRVFRALCVSLILAIGMSTVTQAHPVRPKRAAAESYFAKRCADHPTWRVQACIHRAAIHWDVPYSTGRFIAHRESRFHPWVCNSQGSGACGLFQFMPGTYASTPYDTSCGSLYRAKCAALAWAWAWHRGWHSAWGM